jgi:hypothetical protein
MTAFHDREVFMLNKMTKAIRILLKQNEEHLAMERKRITHNID